MSNQGTTLEIFTGIILQKSKIAEHTIHIKIQSADFSKIKYVAGFTTDVFLSNPYYNPHSVSREYSFWNYEPVYNIADLAINTFSNGEGTDWVKGIQEGDTIFFKEPSGDLVIDQSGENYFLIGDITALSHLYEINRALAVSKEVYSLIYAGSKEDVFPDIDHSFPLKYYILRPIDSESILDLINIYFPKDSKNTVAYVLGDSENATAIYKFLKDNPDFDIQRIYFKSFWKKNGNANNHKKFNDRMS
ncbi:FAD-binding oxidoreductase [Sphingobacterium sp. DR205]|uniref:FAD-binding oxidoreductase n=1 Tax=Sphingobacterium sp. DR205 TaxID=2713573 RepID=UPI0013E48360|nr:FAD-binding oxidoreductase [Sphingobacterium sp. DR205]QIH32753.1 hypothetical protein G6053_07530 [Sphingobacterium sp. DR205]